MLKTRLFAGVAGVVVLLALGAGVVLAQSGDEGTGTSFLDRVAQKLGIDRPKLDQALRDARSDEIDAAVQRGDLTQEQADRLKSRIDELPALDGRFGFGIPHPGGPFEKPFGRGPAFGFGFAKDGQEKLAEFLGVTTEELRAELSADGATLAKVAETHGKSREELKAFLRSEAKAGLDEAVANGAITQARADEILAKIDAGADAMIDASGAKHLGAFRFGFDHGLPRPDRGVPEQPQSGGAPRAPRT